MLGDTSQDLIHVALTKENGLYTAHTTRLISGLNSPLGIEKTGNILYVVETGLQGSNNSPKLWVITLPVEGVTSVKKSTGIPNKLVLYQNFPNPFNPSTTVRFTLPVRSFVVLKVYDLLGREVTTIVSEELDAGEYSRQWNASAMPSGVYFYRIQARQAGTTTAGGQPGTFSEVRKLIVLK